MKPFTYERATLARRSCVGRGRARPGAKFIAGGTNLLDLMKLQIETPAHLIDVNDLGLDKIEPTPEGGLRIGALVRNTDLAADARVRRDYGVLSRALVAGASGQLRNQATTAGNLLQRTRCPYFYDTNQPCNKRAPGQRLRGDRRLQPAARDRRRERRVHRDAPERHGGRDARARRDGRDGARRTARRARIPIADFHRLPGNTPHIETTLEPGELITAVTLPKPVGGTQIYRKVRDRASYAFALVSVAAIVQRDGTGPRRAGRRRAQAVARRGGRARDAARREGRRGDGCSPARARRTTTHSRCRWSSARSPRSSPKRKG